MPKAIDLMVAALVGLGSAGCSGPGITGSVGGAGGTSAGTTAGSSSTASSGSASSGSTGSSGSSGSTTGSALPASGTYQCQGTGRGGSCDQPFFDPTINARWTLVLGATQLTIQNIIGFDQGQIACAGGGWSGSQFTCSATWSRAGRSCSGPMYLQANADGTVTFALNPTFQSPDATCAR